MSDVKWKWRPNGIGPNPCNRGFNLQNHSYSKWNRRFRRVYRNVDLLHVILPLFYVACCSRFVTGVAREIRAKGSRKYANTYCAISKFNGVKDTDPIIYDAECNSWWINAKSPVASYNFPYWIAWEGIVPKWLLYVLGERKRERFAICNK